jgi:D-alanine-D-alanine ligase
VSVISARGVARALDPVRWSCVPIGVTPGGRWLPFEASGAVLDSELPRVVPAEPDDGSRIVADPGGGGLVLLRRGGAAERVEIDAIFSVVHGWGGEDGRIQAVLELAGIPFVGPGVLGSAVGMDKAVAKRLFECRGLPVAPWRLVRRSDHAASPDAEETGLAAALGFPMFVKPANGGSSVGITKVRRREDLKAALDLAFSLDSKAVVEKGLDVREVLGNDSPEASVVGEIVPSNEFYDYAAKYLDGSSQLRIPAPLPEASAGRIRELAVAAFRALDLEGLARVDFFVERPSGAIWLNEVNTLPGFTPISMFPKLWEASGLPYPRLLDRLLDLAFEAFEARGRRAAR